VYFSLAFPGGRLKIPLRVDDRRWRQAKDLERILSGEADQAEAQLYCKGDPFKGGAVMVKLVAHFRRERKDPGEKTLLVRTDPAAFLVAEVCEPATRTGEVPTKVLGDPWILNADNVRRKVAEHDAFRQRMSEDLKHEKRWPGQTRERMNGHLDVRCRKVRDYLDNHAHTVSRMLANYALRRRCGTVVWDDKERGYLPHYPWSQFKLKLAYKLKEEGVTLITTTRSEEAASGAAENGSHETNGRHKPKRVKA